MSKKILIFISLLFAVNMQVMAKDKRQQVELPAPMVQHMMSNMRDHLLALQEITRHLSSLNYDEAADVAEKRLGMSSMESHGASHMGKFMPKEMGKIGTQMHRAASRFALSARDAELDGGLNKAFAALSDVMSQCVACHTSYRVH